MEIFVFVIIEAKSKGTLSTCRLSQKNTGHESGTVLSGKSVAKAANTFSLENIKKYLTSKYSKYSDYADELEQAVKVESGVKNVDDLVKMYGCFTATTPVQTANGAVPIASITEADQVLSYNHQTGKNDLKRIFNIKRHVVKGLLLLGLSTGQTIEATPNHPFYVGGSYREAAALHVGDTLKTVNQSPVVLQSVNRKDTVASVYNFTVADNLNYFVGEPGVLVHNSCAMDMLELKKYSKLKESIDNIGDLKGTIMADLKNADAKRYDVLNTDEGLNAWKMLNQHPYPNLRKDADVITNLGSIIKSKSIDADMLAKAIDNAYSGNVPGFGTKSFIETVEKLKDIQNIGAVVKQVTSSGSGVRKGAAFVLKKAEELGASNIISFEEKVLVTNDKVRIYDMLLKGGGRVECKSWSRFYEATIEKQFLKGDLVGANDLSDIRYFVDEKDMSLDDWFVNMRDFMLKHADEIWKEKRVLILFEQAAELKGQKILNTTDFKNFITNNKDVWFDVIFKQEL